MQGDGTDMSSHMVRGVKLLMDDGDPVGAKRLVLAGADGELDIMDIHGTTFLMRKWNDGTGDMGASIAVRRA